METKISVLVVDDDAAHAKAVAESLERVGYECSVADGGAGAFRALEEQTFDVVVTDLVMADADGLEILAKAKREYPDCEVIILTGHGTIPNAVAAIQAGAFNYMIKPVDIGELRSIVAKASRSKRLASSNEELRRQLDERFGFEGVIGNSTSMNSIINRLKQIAPTSATVLILGESGSGKELVARAIHFNSPRKNKPFVALNCAALNENVLESELFGHAKGAFTGADKERKGHIEHANGGTLFLDEVGEIPLSTQVKLLRVLESGEIVRVGSNEPVTVNVRLLSATNRDLTEAIRSSRFRQDLYHRIKVVSLRLPPLRERREDIPLLIDHFLKEFNESHQKRVMSVSPAARKALMTYAWPGNVRELKNAIESMVVMDCDGAIDMDDLTEDLQGVSPETNHAGSGGADALVGKSFEEIEKYYIAETLKLTDGNREEAAKTLGIGERTLYRKIKEYHIN